jgi:hypothetical protein
VFIPITTANATGFGFPFVTFMASHVVGIISLVVLAVVIVAHSVKHFAGAWRTVYVVGVVAATYFNVFILVVQLFRKIPALIAAAPTQSEPAFVISQVVVLALFIWLGVAAVRGFRGARA